MTSLRFAWAAEDLAQPEAEALGPVGGLPGRRLAISTDVERSCAVMVDEGSSSEAKAFELRLAAVVDAERARLLAIGEDRLEPQG
jgi:hypothetical protein